MSEKIYAVFEMYGRGGDTREFFVLDKEEVETSFNMKDEDEMDESFDALIGKHTFNKAQAIFMSGTLGCMVDENGDLIEKNYEAFKNGNGWFVDGEDVCCGYGATKEEAMIAYFNIGGDINWK